MNHDVSSVNDGVNAGLLILRVMVGVVMVAHGYNHIFRGGKIKGTAGWFASLGMKPGILHAWLASITELGAGVMLILGLLTPLAAAGVVGVMLVALIINHIKNGFFIFRPGEGYEYVLTLLMVGLAIGAIGAGRVVARQRDRSRLARLDRSARCGDRRRRRGLLLLAVFWRPVKPDPAA